MTPTEPLCRSDWHTDTGRHRRRGDRSVRCNLPADHDGDHDELVDGEAGIVTWPRRPRTPEVRTMPAVFPASVAEISDRNGSRYRRDGDGGPYWRRLDLISAWPWQEGELLLRCGPLTEVVPDV